MCTEGEVDKIVLWVGLVLILGIILVMTIVICIMKSRREKEVGKVNRASDHYSDKTRESLYNKENDTSRHSEYSFLVGKRSGN